MTGESYYGYTQWAVAWLNHPNLKCIAPGETFPDIYRIRNYNNSAFCLQTAGTWAYEMNARKVNNPLRLDYWHLPLISMDDDAWVRCDYYKDWIRHPSRDAYWEPINICQKCNQVKIPVYHWGGWYDIYLRGTINGWRGVKENSDSMETRKNQWLLIAPTDHELTPAETHRIGRIDVGKEAWTYDRLQRFFDYWLKGADNGFDRTPRVEISSSNFNRWDRNPNTGHKFGMDAETVKATQTIYHDRQHPSHIILPIIPR